MWPPFLILRTTLPLLILQLANPPPPRPPTPISVGGPTNATKSEPSLEWRIIRSHRILRARVISIDNAIHLQIAELLKGPQSPPSLTVHDTFHKINTPSDNWRRGQADIILFLTPQLDITESIIMDEPHREGFITCDFRRLTAPRDILDIIRKTIAIAPQTTLQLITLQEDQTALDIPNNPDIFMEYAPKWIKSKDYRLRFTAFNAIAPYDTPQTVAVMRQLLSDPFPEYQRDGIFLTRAYPLRMLAMNWLTTRRHAPLMVPILREPDLQPIRTAHYLLALTIPVTIILLAFVLRILIRLPMQRGIISLCAVMLLLVVILTYYRIDEFAIINAKESRHIALLQGRILMISSNQLERPPGLYHASIPVGDSLQTRWLTYPNVTNTGRLPQYLQQQIPIYANFANRTPAYTINVLILPLWPILLLAALPLLWFAFTFLRLRLRLHRGLCPIFAFDLRASGPICPECGHHSPNPLPQ